MYIVQKLLCFFLFCIQPPTECQPVSEENHGQNEVSNATRPWWQQNYDKYGEKMVNKMEKDGKQTKK